MHTEAMEWVAAHATTEKVKVLDIGGRDINGTPRHLFPNAAEYTVIDLRPGVNVDVVADVCMWKPKRHFDVVVCCEVFEHTEEWRDILAAAHDLCAKDGTVIVTAAGPGREPHSAEDGAELRPGEWYENIDPDSLASALSAWQAVTVNVLGPDVRAVARR